MAQPDAHDETGPADAQPAEGSTISPDSGGGQKFRVGNVLKLVLPLVLVGGGVVVFVGFFDGADWLSQRLNPPLVPATGQVIYNGTPLEGAQISTRHVSAKLKGSIGWTDEQGRFTLRTDMDGYIDGAYAGEHRVVVTAYETTNVPAAPPLLTPRNYASLETSPLRIVISRAADENTFTLTLEGDPPERSGATPGGNGGGGGFDPEAIVGRVFDEFDKDDDDKLSAEEMSALEGNRADRIRQADANEDGIVEREELRQALSAPRPPQ